MPPKTSPSVASSSSSNGGNAASSSATSSTSSSIATITYKIAFDDIVSRFILNLPSEELEQQERLFAQLQESHWFYTDFYSDRHGHLPKFNFRSFCLEFLAHQPYTSLRQYANATRFDEFQSRFRDYILSVPVCGCIILSADMRSVVLVKSFRGNSWSWPKGKIDHGESQYDCAAREVHEETGFDCSTYMTANDYIEMKDNTTSHMVRLYIAAGVDHNTAVFKTLTRKEIGAIEWFPIRSLPGGGEEKKDKRQYWLVKPFVTQLMRWIKAKRAGRHTGAISMTDGVAATPATTTATAAANSKTASNNGGAASPKKKKGKKGKNGAVATTTTGGKDRSPNRNGNGNGEHVNAAPNTGSGVAGLGANAVRLFDGSLAPSAGVLQGRGWSPEEMFATNARLGVTSTVVEEPLQYPDNAHEIFAKYLGHNHPHLRSPKFKPSTPSSAPPATSSTSSSHGHGRSSSTTSVPNVSSSPNKHHHKQQSMTIDRRASPMLQRTNSNGSNGNTNGANDAPSAPVSVTWGNIPRPPPLDLDIAATQPGLPSSSSSSASSRTSVSSAPSTSSSSSSSSSRVSLTSPSPLPSPPYPSVTSAPVTPSIVPAGTSLMSLLLPSTRGVASVHTPSAAGMAGNGIGNTGAPSTPSTAFTFTPYVPSPLPSPSVNGATLAVPRPSQPLIIPSPSHSLLGVPLSNGGAGNSNGITPRGPQSSPPAASMLNFRFDAASILDALSSPLHQSSISPSPSPLLRASPPPLPMTTVPSVAV